MASNWTPESWQSREARHLPVYPDAAALGKVLENQEGLQTMDQLLTILKIKMGHQPVKRLMAHALVSLVQLLNQGFKKVMPAGYDSRLTASTVTGSKV